MGKLTKEEFVKKAKDIHGEKYDYSKVEYNGMYEKVCIICPEHGEFWQLPLNHIRNHGCPKCSSEKIKRSSNYTEFTEKAKKVHGNKYDYSKVKYVNARTKVCIICPEHGEFWQTPNSHLSGNGCKKCGNKIISDKKKKNIEEFIEKAKEIHGDKYDYHKSVYNGCDEKIEIICKKHGSFFQNPLSHLHGCGCPICAKEKLSKNNRCSKEDFIKNATEIHKGKYDYSKVEYVNGKTKVCIICPEHGEFWQSPNNHLKGKGCKKCGIKSAINKNRIAKENVLDTLNKIHDGKYDYSKLNFDREKDKVCIICPKHGEFWQTLDSHLRGIGCPKCAKKISKAEIEIKNFIENILGECSVEERNRNIISPYEIDLYIPSKKIGIEYNGLLWHSEKYNKDKNYHLNKTILANKNGIRLIQIFEDEYLNKKEIVFDKLKHILGCNDGEKIYGRKCEIKEISKKECSFFMQKNHIQGYSKSNVCIGCFYKNELIGSMCFLKDYKNSDNWELNRFSTKLNTNCIGCGGKMLSFFLKKYNPSEIKSFADVRWVDSNNNFYEKLGFIKDLILKPDYKYIKLGMCERVHKFNFRKSKICKLFNSDNLKSESEIMNDNGYYKIWDCGLIRYKFINNQ